MARRRVAESGRGRGPTGAPRLKKALGQHHLARPELCRPAIEYLGQARADGDRPQVLEIGPGGGVLTRALLEAGWRVLAVELDREWAFELRRRFAPGTRGAAGLGGALQVVIGDALELSFSRLEQPWAVAGNLPYAVSTAIVERVLDQAPTGTRCAFLVQREVADRLLAVPGSRVYGSLSVLVSLRSRGRRLARVRPGSFRPPPKVESAFVGLEILGSELGEESWRALKKTVRNAFASRRKTLANVLAAAYGAERGRRALVRCGIDPGLRAEALAPEQLVALHHALEAP
jgi:16S rRNA (adenine1518-N6/adenine1519-N6)-dimethyltransferase